MGRIPPKLRPPCAPADRLQGLCARPPGPGRRRQTGGRVFACGTGRGRRRNPGRPQRAEGIRSGLLQWRLRGPAAGRWAPGARRGACPGGLSLEPAGPASLSWTRSIASRTPSTRTGCGSRCPGFPCCMQCRGGSSRTGCRTASGCPRTPGSAFWRDSVRRHTAHRVRNDSCAHADPVGSPRRRAAAAAPGGPGCANSGRRVEGLSRRRAPGSVGVPRTGGRGCDEIPELRRLRSAGVLALGGTAWGRQQDRNRCGRASSYGANHASGSTMRDINGEEREDCGICKRGRGQTAGRVHQ